MTPLFDPAKVTFVKEGHEYYVDVDGTTKKMPSLSHVLKKVGMTPEYGSDIPSYVLEKAARRGEAVHLAVSNHLQGREWELEEAHHSYFWEAEKLIKKYDIKAHMVETPLYNPVFDYCCTPDLVGEVRGKPAIVDWKTTTKISFQAGFQVCGQALCFREPDEFELYIGDLKNGLLQRFPSDKYMRVTRNGLQLYNDVLEIWEDGLS